MWICECQVGTSKLSALGRVNARIRSFFAKTSFLPTLHPRFVGGLASLGRRSLRAHERRAYRKGNFPCLNCLEATSLGREEDGGCISQQGALRQRILVDYGVV